MTIDERLDRLTERHEALTQSVELLYRDIQEMKAATEREGENIRVQAAATTRNFEIVLDSIRSLEKIAAAHEHRISQIEGEE